MSNVQCRTSEIDVGSETGPRIILELRSGTLDFGPWTLDIGHLTASADATEKARRERLLRHLESAGQSAPAGIGKVQPGASWRVFFGGGVQTIILPIVDLSAGQKPSSGLCLSAGFCLPSL